MLRVPVHRGEAVEKQLAEVSEGDGVGAGDALADDLLDQVAEEEVHRLGRGELVDGGEEVSGNRFGGEDLG